MSPTWVHTRIKARCAGASGGIGTGRAGHCAHLHGHTFNSYFNSFTSNVYVNTERLLARRSSAIVAISQTQKKELVEAFRIAPEEKFRVIQLGLDPDKFTAAQEEKRVRFRRELT